MFRSLRPFGLRSCLRQSGSRFAALGYAKAKALAYHKCKYLDFSAATAER
jgi:hypothetical protein